MKTKNYLILLILLLSISCSKKKPSIEQIKKIPVHEEKINSSEKVEINDKNEHHFLIITADYNFESAYYGIIQNEYTLKGKALEAEKRPISFGKYKDVLMGGKYNSSGAFYPVQFNFLKDKVYLSIYKADEMEGTFDYNKILEYDINSDSIREIMSFSDYFNSWYLSTPNNKIYGFDSSSKSILSIEINTLKVDTLYTYTSYFEEIEYHPDTDKSLDIITFDRKNGVAKFNINYDTSKIIKTNLYPLTSFSSYRKNSVVQTYKDYNSDIEELRIYNKSGKKSIPFDFKNFNTLWINDTEFLVIKKNEIQKINTDLEVVNSFKRKNIHVIDVVDDLIFISYFEENEDKVGVLTFDFEHLIEIPNIKSEEIVAIKEK